MHSQISIQGILLWVFVLLMPGLSAQAQQQYAWVYLADKPHDATQPPADLTPQAIARRQAQRLPLWDVRDYPVHGPYLDGISQHADSVLFASRWINAVAVRATPQQLTRLSQLGYVRIVVDQGMLPASPATPSPLASIQDEPRYSKTADRYRRYQLKRMGYDLLQSKGLTGKDVIVAVFDAGFTGVDIDPLFTTVRERLIATYDFVGNDSNVYHGSRHGTTVLSCIGGETPQGPIGLATAARFLLARTEMANREPFMEEINWGKAVEWADRMGAHVINSSLGYTSSRYTVAHMDGQHSYVARMANMAASKGILVVNAAGNEGSIAWKRIITPADADSVLAVGGTDPVTDIRISFSSFGPSTDGRLKPEVCAPGHAAGANGKSQTGKKQARQGLGTHYGTSFASPLVAGFAACMRQKYPEISVMELKQRIMQCGHLYPYYDYSHGHGIPTAARIDMDTNQTSADSTFRITNFVQGKTSIKETARPQCRISLQNLLPPPSTHYNLFYHISTPQGKLKAYYVATVSAKECAPDHILTLSITDLAIESGDLIRIHYEGHMQTILVP